MEKEQLQKDRVSKVESTERETERLHSMLRQMGEELDEAQVKIAQFERPTPKAEAAMQTMVLPFHSVMVNTVEPDLAERTT